MPPIVKRRPKHATRRLDIAAIKQALADDRVYPCLGLVTDEDVASHYSLDDEDLLVEVALMPGEERVTARMGLFGMGPNAGIWSVPPVGTEVALMVCDGELEGGVFIVGILSTGNVPDGVAENVIVIAAPSKVLIHDGDGGAQPLAKADHTHRPPTLVGATYGAGHDATKATGASLSNTTVLEGK
jgi:hypothetical protein